MITGRNPLLKKLKRTLLAACSGVVLLQSVCTSEAVREQWASGFTTAVSGLFELATEHAADQLFGVN